MDGKKKTLSLTRDSTKRNSLSKQHIDLSRNKPKRMRETEIHRQTDRHNRLINSSFISSNRRSSKHTSSITSPPSPLTLPNDGKCLRFSIQLGRSAGLPSRAALRCKLARILSHIVFLRLLTDFFFFLFFVGKSPSQRRNRLSTRRLSLTIGAEKKRAYFSSFFSLMKKTRKISIPRSSDYAGGGFGFTLRHFVVYPPSVSVNDILKVKRKKKNVRSSNVRSANSLGVVQRGDR